MSLPLAEVNYVEATWVMIVKSIVIFLAVFAIVPVLTSNGSRLSSRIRALVSHTETSIANPPCD